MHYKITIAEILSKGLFSTFIRVPPNVTSLDISLCDLTDSKISTEELISAFNLLPASITSLNLYATSLLAKPCSELIEIIKAFPPKLKVLNLNEASYQGTVNELITLLNLFPSTLISLGFGTNLDKCLENITLAQIKRLIRALPPKLTSLNLGNNRLGNRTVAELVCFFKGLPLSLTSLDLYNNGLGQKTAEELVTIFQAIPPSITDLKLGFTFIESKTTEELIMILTGLPLGVTALTLHYDCSRVPQTITKYIQAITTLPARVTELDLTYNYFMDVPPEPLDLFFNAIPKTVTSIALHPYSERGNLFPSSRALTSVTKLTLFFSDFNRLTDPLNDEVTTLPLPPNVVSLHLLWTPELLLNIPALIKFFNALPESIRDIDLRNNTIAGATEKDWDLLFRSVVGLEYKLILDDDIHRAIITPKMENVLHEILPFLPIPEIAQLVRSYFAIDHPIFGIKKITPLTKAMPELVYDSDWEEDSDLEENSESEFTDIVCTVQ